MAKPRRIYRTTIAVILFLSSLLPALASGQIRIPLISPWMDHHDRIESIISRFQPPASVIRFDLERDGGQGSLKWWPAFGAPFAVPLSQTRLVIFENAPKRALARLQNERGRPLDQAMESWVRDGGHLLIIGGSPSIESYGGSRWVQLMGFEPDSDSMASRRRKRRQISGEGLAGVHIDYLHEGFVTTARIRLIAGGRPFVLENCVGAGRVTTVLSGAQGQRRADGGELDDEWFASPSWAQFLLSIINAASETSFSLSDESAKEVAPAPSRKNAFDIRYFQISNQPYPYSLAPGEAYERARELRRLGFTSIVSAVNRRRPKDTLRVLREIEEAGLRIVYYDALRRQSPKTRFLDAGALPQRARSRTGEDKGWDIHDPLFWSAADRLLVGNEEVPELPLRAIQLIEEFKDGGMIGPTLEPLLRSRGLSEDIEPGDPRWIEAEVIRADATAETFLHFRATGKRLFPDLPHSTYWPGSYWQRPFDYVFRLTALSEAVDEVLGPGYGYASRRRGPGPASVRRSATEAWVAMRDSSSNIKHMAVYAQGRPLTRKGGRPGLDAWQETAWTALAHGATGLAYWALPKGEAIAGLEPIHRELTRLGPWLAAAERTPAPVALLESWTTRNEGSLEAAKNLSRCLQRTQAALELGFEDVDLVFEERLDRLPISTRALVIVASPALSEKAVSGLESFVQRGGHIFLEPGSAIRAQPGGRPIDLSVSTGRSEQIHILPLLGRCKAATVSPAVAATALRKSLDDIGLQPRVETAVRETEATLRGDPELLYVYGLNHGEQPRQVVVRLAPEIQGRNWVELRGGQPDIPSRPNEIRSDHPVAPGEAAIWVSARRPAHTLQAQIEREEKTLTLHISGRDAQGEILAEGYPIEAIFSAGGICGDTQSVSTVLSSGEASIEIAICDPLTEEKVSWRVMDPLTGRSTEGESTRPTATTP